MRDVNPTGLLSLLSAADREQLGLDVEHPLSNTKLVITARRSDDGTTSLSARPSAIFGGMSRELSKYAVRPPTWLTSLPVEATLTMETSLLTGPIVFRVNEAPVTDDGPWGMYVKGIYGSRLGNLAHEVRSLQKAILLFDQLEVGWLKTELTHAILNIAFGMGFASADTRPTEFMVTLAHRGDTARDRPVAYAPLHRLHQRHPEFALIFLVAPDDFTVEFGRDEGAMEFLNDLLQIAVAKVMAADMNLEADFNRWLADSTDIARHYALGAKMIPLAEQRRIIGG